MRLQTKLVLGYAGFVLALGVLGAWSARTLSQMSAVSGHIIAENYDSVVAAQDMKESLERQDRFINEMLSFIKSKHTGVNRTECSLSSIVDNVIAQNSHHNGGRRLHAVFDE